MSSSTSVGESASIDSRIPGSYAAAPPGTRMESQSGGGADDSNGYLEIGSTKHGNVARESTSETMSYPWVDSLNNMNARYATLCEIDVKNDPALMAEWQALLIAMRDRSASPELELDSPRVDYRSIDLGLRKVETNAHHITERTPQENMALKWQLRHVTEEELEDRMKAKKPVSTELTSVKLRPIDGCISNSIGDPDHDVELRHRELQDANRRTWSYSRSVNRKSKVTHKIRHTESLKVQPDTSQSETG